MPLLRCLVASYIEHCADARCLFVILFASLSLVVRLREIQLEKKGNDFYLKIEMNAIHYRVLYCVARCVGR